jgi:hypothetical protein
MPPELSFSRGWNSRVVRAILLPAYLYACWLGMMAVHELGHVLHAWVSGGVVSAVRVPLAGFSITVLSSNPHPHFVAWGGAVWGCALPVAAWLAWPGRWRGLRALQFFAGFCLLANGAYLGMGWTMRAGDAADLVRYRTPVWVLVLVGLCGGASGLYLWHRLGVERRSPFGTTRQDAKGAKTAKEEE